jgi:hypothetical protein
MALTTLLGSAQLAVQDALSAALETDGGVMRVPNFIVVSIRREAFLSQYRGPLTTERERFRRELGDGVRTFLASHGWRVAGAGGTVVNVLLRSLREDCAVQVRTVNALCDLEISDDRGIRSESVRHSPAAVGRAHNPHPRGFVAVHDESRLWSREHLVLTYADLHLMARLVGRNPTTLNGDSLGDAEVELHSGDVIRCGKCEIVVKRVE